MEGVTESDNTYNTSQDYPPAVHIHTHTHTYTHTYIHTHTYTHTYIHTLTTQLSCWIFHVFDRYLLYFIIWRVKLYVPFSIFQAKASLLFSNSIA